MFTGLVDKGCFPIDSIERTVELFKKQLTTGAEPNLALLSIVVGAIENNLTGSRAISSDKESSVHLNKLVKVGFPELSLTEVSTLYEKFVSIIKNAVDPKAGIKGNFATREIIKRVSDVIWNSLTRSYYKDRAHLQSIFSYLSGKKLDCFGVAFAVVAGCQVLGYNDVHLALSEDHAWVVFGKNGVDTAEVTWHGKGNEDKRGQPIGTGVLSRSWLYVAGHPVVCTRAMEVAALVSSINPSLTSTTDVYEVALMQQHLLWLLYDQGHLNAYPMALGNLGELEEASRYNDGKYRPDCSELFLEAIKSAQNNYSNRHVYPYTYQGAYFYRKKMYKEAFGSWADAGDVIRLYNYSRDDEEIYKEFLEIANELIPQIMKAESSGHSARSILKDPQCFAHLLRFYDGICKWEEESQTPILHIGWAKPLVNTISKFDADVRAQVIVLCCEEEDIPENSNLTNSEEDKPAPNLNEENDLTPKDQDKKMSIDNPPETKKEVEVNAPSSDSVIQPETVSEVTKSTSIINPQDKQPDEKAVPVFPRPPVEPHSKPQPRELGEELEAVVNSHPTTKLYSHKMKGLKNLLLAEKLNTHAISLHLTAQSQVFINKKSRAGGEPIEPSVHCSTRPKRVRRE